MQVSIWLTICYPGQRSDGSGFTKAPDKRDTASASPTPDVFSLAKGDDEEQAQAKAQEQNGSGEQISAADYDPSLDRREDEHKRVWGTKERPADVEMIEEDEEDDVEDMFAVATSEKKKFKKVKRVLVSNPSF